MSKLVERMLSLAVQSERFLNLVAPLEQADEQRPNLLRILTYHRVDQPAAFQQQMIYLASHYHVVSMTDLLTAHRYGDELPPRSILLTFDDAYRNFAEAAWPILRRYGLPVTLFVATAYPDHPRRMFWWDQLYHAVTSTPRRDELTTPMGRLPLQTPRQRAQTYRRLRDYVKTLDHAEALTLVAHLCRQLDMASSAAPPAGRAQHQILSWEELRHLAQAGVTLGAHSRTHPLMNRISAAEARSEAMGSLQDLEREIGPVPPIFAYPSGHFNDEIVKLLADEGFELAFTTVRGTNRLWDADPLRLRRNNVGARATVGVLRARLLQASPHLNGLRPLPGRGQMGRRVIRRTSQGD